MTYRLIPTETHSAPHNPAYDEACMEAVQAGESPGTIRLYQWARPTVSIGYFQCLTDEVDVEKAKELGVDTIRRITGGGAMYLDPAGEVTYSVIAPEKDFSESIEESYEEIIRPVVEGLQRVGVDARFSPLNDVLVGEKKISGSAQTRRGGVLLQHGTVLLSVDPETMFELLTPDKAKISDKPYVKSVKSAVTSVEEHSTAGQGAVEEALRAAFCRAFGAEQGVWTAAEKQRAAELAEHKYGTDEWVAMR